MTVHKRFAAAALAVATIVTGALVAQRAASTPLAVVRTAEQAVLGDSVPALQARWTSELARARGDGRAAPLLGLATLARLTYDYAAAERHYQALLAGRAATDRWAAWAQLGRGHSFYWRSRFAPAETAYVAARDAAAAAGEPAAAAEAIAGVVGRRPTAVAMAMLDTAFTLAAGDRALQAWVLCRRAPLQRDASWEERFALVDSGARLARRARSPRMEGRCAHARASLHGNRGDTDPAVEHFRRADSLYALARDVGERAQMLSRLGYRYIVSGDYGAARQSLRQSIPLARQSQHERYLGSSHIGLAAVALRVNDHATAAEQLRLAEAVAEELNDASVRELAASYRADLATQTGDFATARRVYEEQLPVLMKRGEDYNEWVIRRNFAQLGMRMRDWALAERELAAARALAERARLTGPMEEQPEHEGRLALLRGEYRRAVDLYTEALTTLDTSTHSLRYGVRARLAQAYGGLGDLARAERELTAASDEIDTWRESLEDAELRLLASELCGCSDQDLGVAHTLSMLVRGGREEAAFALAERRRARELVNRMMQAEVLRDERSAPGTLRGRVGAALQAHPSAADIVAALPDARTALLEYVTGPDLAPTTLFVLSKAGLRTFTLPPLDSLAPELTRFNTLVEQGDDPTALARALGAALLDSAAAVLPAGVTRLVIVPDGILHRLPYDALRLADERVVLERFAVSVAPSASVARALWSRGASMEDAAASARLLAVGDPAFAGERGAADSRGETLRSAFDSAGGLARLAGSGREARQVARFAAESDVRVRAAASEAFFKQAPLERFDVLHLATHALVDDRTAARTALALAPGGGEDGFLSAGDVAALRLDADLVVLSACRTAGGVLLGSEGVWGLTGPLLQAGARAVVATSWRIGDETAVQLVDDFYGGLARGLAVSDALREAKLAAMRRGLPPRDWAAFTVVGDPMVTVPLQQPSPWTRVPPWALLVGGAVLAGAAAFGAARMRRLQAH